MLLQSQVVDRIEQNEWEAKITTMRNMTPCSFFDVYGRFGSTCGSVQRADMKSY